MVYDSHIPKHNGNIKSGSTHGIIETTKHNILCRRIIKKTETPRLPKNREKTTKQSNENRPNIKENIESCIFYKVLLYK